MDVKQERIGSFGYWRQGLFLTPLQNRIRKQSIAFLIPESIYLQISNYVS